MGYFLNNTNKCVEEIDCGENYYPERANMKCTLCDIACLGCSSGGNLGCILCHQKYTLTPIGTCELILCPLDEYYDTISLICQSK